LLGSTLSACSPSEIQDVHIRVSVHDDQSAAQPSVPVEIDGLPVATTDDAGITSITFQAHANRVRVAVRCAAGYHSPEPRSIPLSRHARQPPLDLQFVCRPAQRSLLLVVRAPLGVGLPVLVDGEQVGTVASDGTLHAVVQRAPEATVRVTLDTTNTPTLVPQQPVREIKVSDQDEFIVFDQVLSVAPAKSRRVHGLPPRSAGTKHIPYAIGRLSN
jgi:hypothetical protein